MEPSEKPVQGQLEAYNRHDVDAFCSFYCADIVVLDFASGKEQSRGMERFRPQYEALFRKNPGIHAQAVHRTVLGKFVLDEELVTGLPDGREIRAVAVYEVIDSLIRRVWFVRG